MSQLFLRALTASALLVTAVGCAGDPVGTADQSLVDASASLGAADPKSPYAADATSLVLAPGATHQLSATKVANGKDVPESSVQWSSSDAAVATVSGSGLVTAVAAGEATISITRGAHQVDVAVTVTGCGLSPLVMGTTTGAITSDDCVFPSGRFADFFSVTTVPGQIVEFYATGVAGAFGFRTPAANLVDGNNLGSVGIGSAPIRVIANGSPFNVFVSANLGVTGSYTLAASAPSEPHHCDVYNFVTPGTSFGATVTAENACHYAVQYSPVTEAIGKPLAAHGYNILLTELKPYTVTITGLTDSFDATLTVFGPGGVVAQNVAGALPSPGTRSVTFTPSAAAYYYIEISGGRFVNGLDDWQTQMGSYQISISQ